MSIRLSFACGHAQTVSDTEQVPICETCGERRVSRVTARAPKFRGVCQGPHAQYAALAGMPVVVGDRSDG